ncbi:MAG: hypothetical protein OEQ53_18000, partial [Saprospiraceae bacterium]|nr:hypothetical protein [Saprospiraceae bacterium]
MIRQLLLSCILLVFCNLNFAQVSEIELNPDGVIVPRLDRTTIVSPVAGQLVYDINTSSFWFHNGATWTELGGDFGLPFDGQVTTTSSDAFSIENLATDNSNGIRGKINGNGIGVKGESMLNGVGVEGTGGSGIGIKGSGATYAGHFTGKLYVTNNVGIGSTTPNEKLVIGMDIGDLPGTRLTIADPADFTAINLGESADNRGFLLWHNHFDLLKLGTRESGVTYDNALVLRTGNIGIGTSNPSEKMHVQGGNLLLDRGGTSSALTRTLVIEGAGNAAGDAFAQLDFHNYDDDSSPNSYVGARISAHNATGASNGELQFSVPRGGFVKAMSIDETQVNIFSDLDITGDLNVDAIDASNELEVRDADLLLDRHSATSGLTRKLTITGARSLTNEFASIDFRNIDDNDGNAEYVGARISAANDLGDLGDSGGLNFYTSSSVGGLRLAMRLGTGPDFGSPNNIGSKIFESLSVDGSVEPIGDNQHFLGGPSTRWRTVF